MPVLDNNAAFKLALVHKLRHAVDVVVGHVLVLGVDPKHSAQPFPARELRNGRREAHAFAEHFHEKSEHFNRFQRRGPCSLRSVNDEGFLSKINDITSSLKGQIVLRAKKFRWTLNDNRFAL